MACLILTKVYTIFTVWNDMWPALYFKIISLAHVPFEIDTQGVDLLYMLPYKVFSCITQRCLVKTVLLWADFSALHASHRAIYTQDS